MSFKAGCRKLWQDCLHFWQNDSKNILVVSLTEVRAQTLEVLSDKLYVICLPEDEQYGLWLQLPEGMSAEEQKTAAFWELDANLQEQGLRAEDFVVKGFPYSRVSGENYWLAAVRRDVLQTLAEEMKLPHFDFVALPSEILPEEIPVLYQQKDIGLSAKKKMERWNYVRLSFLTGAIFLLSITLMGTNDVVHYVQAQRQLHLAEQNMQAMQPVKQRLEHWQNEQTILKNKQQQLKGLTEKSLPWYAMLLHLGVHTQDGVVVQSVQRGEGQDAWQLRGTAEDYDALSQYIQQLAADDFFAGQVQLTESTAKEGEDIAFSLALLG